VGIEKQAREAKKAHIVVATPGRLEDLIARRAISLSRVRTLVLDEADRMLDMGFRPVIDRIVAQCPRERQTLFFSATLDGEAGRIAAEYTHSDAVRHEHVAPKQDVADIAHRFVRVERDHRIRALVGELRADRGLALVFVRTKRGADRLVKRLAGEGVRAVAMHGDKTQGQRERALASFEAGRVDTLVATDVAARGIDVSGISHVINFDPPEDREGYVHRTGRTGRAGATGHAVTFVGGEQASDVGKIASELRLHEEFSQAGLGHAGRSHGRAAGGSGGSRTGGAGPRGGNSGGNGGGRSKRRPRSSSGSGSTAGSGRGSRHGGGSGANGSSPQKVASARPSRRSGRR
jgi:superfamily II DNA/RNA helicase